MGFVQLFNSLKKNLKHIQDNIKFVNIGCFVNPSKFPKSSQLENKKRKYGREASLQFSSFSLEQSPWKCSMLAA